MRIASNRITDVQRFFLSELEGLYPAEEISVFADLCFEHYLGMTRTQRLVNQSATVSESTLLKLNAAVKSLKQGKPLQYILGEADFYGRKFFVDPRVLIPRPETEELVDLIVKDHSDRKNLSVLDIGTGSGCIAISLAKHLEDARVTAADVSPGALEVAMKNAERHAASIRFIGADILSPAGEITDMKFHLIVSNPPYVCRSESDEMEQHVLEHEPHLALFVEDNDPLLFYRAIARYAQQTLIPGGRVYFEINPVKHAEMTVLMQQEGFKNVIVLKDLNNKNRILRGNI